jgi:hypothetical protein
LFEFAKKETPGVGSGPNKVTSIPDEIKPACKADSNIYPDILVSLPMNTLDIPSSFKTQPVAHPSLVTKRGFMVEVTGPLIPSVPNFLSLLSVERLEISFFLMGNILLIKKEF